MPCMLEPNALAARLDMLTPAWSRWFALESHTLVRGPCFVLLQAGASAHCEPLLPVEVHTCKRACSSYKIAAVPRHSGLPAPVPR